MAQAPPRLQECPPELPRDADLSPDWFAREMATAFSQNRVMVRFLADLPPTILWPSAYVVALPDYLRVVRLEPESPDRTRLVAKILFAPETLSQPIFNPAEIASFAKTVLAEEAAAAKMNQRGIASPGFTAARQMPEEYEIHRFHQWLLTEMEKTR